MTKKSRSLGTHDGSFHADEVTACALLLFADLIDFDKIIRTRDTALLEECEYVCDVGGVWNPSLKKFDHHQVDYTGPLSSAGMILEYLRDEKKISYELFLMIRNSLVAAVDAHDNGRDPAPPGVTTYSTLIGNFCPIQQDAEPELQDHSFFEAVQFAQGHIRRLAERFHYIQSCRDQVIREMERSKKEHPTYLSFEKAIPWMDAFFERGGEVHTALFVIMPVRNHWKLRGIPPNLSKRMSVRKSLPEKWAGLEGEPLQKVSAIPGAIFCHKGRFIAIFKEKEEALLALEKVIAEGDK